MSTPSLKWKLPGQKSIEPIGTKCEHRIKRKAFPMNQFSNLRCAAGLTFLEVVLLLNIDLAKVEAYENGLLTPRPRELRVLVGLARIAKKSPSNLGCESEKNSANVPRSLQKPQQKRSTLRAGVTETAPMSETECVSAARRPDENSSSGTLCVGTNENVAFDRNEHGMHTVRSRSIRNSVKSAESAR